jgi:hypothetical protein
VRARDGVGLAIALVVVSGLFDPAGAFGVRYPDVTAMATSTRAGVISWIRGVSYTWSLEIAERELFGGVGLGESGARIHLAPGRWRFTLEAASLRAGPGGELRLAARAGVSSSWTMIVGVVHDRADIAGFPVAHRTTVALDTGMSVLEWLHVHCHASGLRVAGVSDPALDDRGADVATGVTAVAGAAAITAVLAVDRWTGAHARFSAAVRLPAGAVVVGGYDDESASLSLALSVGARDIRAAAAVSAHPVLGLSRGVSVGWER